MESKELLAKIAENLEKIASDRDKYLEESRVQKEQINQLKLDISKLEAQLKNSLEVQKAPEQNVKSSTDEDIKKRIDGLVEEIDECLALLNN